MDGGRRLQYPLHFFKKNVGIMKKNQYGRPFDTILPEKSILPAHSWANMAGRRNNTFTFVLFKLLIVSQFQIFSVYDVVWSGLDVV